MKFEIRYTVLKNKDIDKYLNPKQITQLNSICDIVEEGRKKEGRDNFGCLVIEKDWPEFGPTLRSLSMRVDIEYTNNVVVRAQHKKNKLNAGR